MFVFVVEIDYSTEKDIDVEIKGESWSSRQYWRRKIP